MKFDAQGRELPDPTPVELPLGFKRPESLNDQIRRMIRGEMSAQASAAGNETFEEANDFDVDEDDAELHGTQYELMADDELVLAPPVAPRPKPDQEDDDDDETDATGRGDDDDSGLSSGPGVDDGDDYQAAPSGAAAPGQDRPPGRHVARPTVGGSGKPAPTRKGRPDPAPRPGKRQGRR